MEDVYPRFTVAGVQAAPVLFDREKTIDKAVRFIQEAADNGAVIIGFPEVYVPGHPNIWYHGKKFNPLHSQGQMFVEMVKNGVVVPSPATDRLCQAAKKAHAYVVIGICEVDALYPGTLYLSQLFISHAGEIMGVHRKMVPTIEEKLIFTGSDGSYLNTYDTPYGKISALNCGEHTNSLYKYALLAMGTQIHVASWPSFPDHIYGERQRNSVDFRVRQFAHEGKIFVINCCAVTDEQNTDVCCDTQEEKENIVKNSGGGSSIIAPSGDYLAGPVYQGEGIVSAEISLEYALPGKQLHNVLGHYTRWDVLSLNFNRERLSPFKNVTPPQPGLADFSRELQAARQEIREISERLDRLVEKAES